MKHKAVKIGLTSLVLAVAFGGLLFTTLGEATEYYKHVDEVMAEPGRVVRQEAAAARLRRARTRSRRSATPSNIGSRCRTTAQVVDATYTGVVPDTFKDDAEVVLKGTLSPEGFDGRARTASWRSARRSTKPRHDRRPLARRSSRRRRWSWAASRSAACDSHFMASLGAFLLLLAFVVAAYAAAASVAGARRRSTALIESGIGAFYLSPR